MAFIDALGVAKASLATLPFVVAGERFFAGFKAIGGSIPCQGEPTQQLETHIGSMLVMATGGAMTGLYGCPEAVIGCTGSGEGGHNAFVKLN